MFSPNSQSSSEQKQNTVDIHDTFPIFFSSCHCCCFLPISIQSACLPLLCISFSLPFSLFSSPSVCGSSLTFFFIRKKNTYNQSVMFFFWNEFTFSHHALPFCKLGRHPLWNQDTQSNQLYLKHTRRLVLGFYCRESAIFRCVWNVCNEIWSTEKIWRKLCILRAKTVAKKFPHSPDLTHTVQSLFLLTKINLPPNPHTLSTQQIQYFTEPPNHHRIKRRYIFSVSAVQPCAIVSL